LADYVLPKSKTLNPEIDWPTDVLPKSKLLRATRLLIYEVYCLRKYTWQWSQFWCC